jgi:predicted DCC family thiol-disulfide oxidoreductase YuxK
LNNAGNEHQWLLYYDGDCGLCDRAKRWLSKMDFFNFIVWIPYQVLESSPQGLSWNDLALAAYLDTGQGRLIRGFYAFRMLALRLLPLIPLAPIFWFPGMNLVGEAVYGWVASNRFRLSGCHRVGG